MTLNERIDRELARLATVGDLGTGITLSIDSTCGRFESELTEVDRIGCSVCSFALVTDRLADATVEQLQQVCDQLAQQIGYLLEPIAPIETDMESCTMQMRSNPPHADEDRTSYYELVVRRGGQLHLCRYAKARGSVRQVVSAHITHEVFRRLAADFEAAVA